MKLITLHIIIDFIFKFVLVFLLNIIWCTYFIPNSLLAIAVAIILTTTLLFIFNKISYKKHNKKLTSVREEQKILDIKNTFIFMTKEEIVTFFFKLASTKHICTKQKSFIEIESQDKPIISYPIYNQAPLNADKVLNIYKTLKNKNIKKLIILTNELTPEVKPIAQNFNFETLILNNKEVYYNLLKEYEFYPEIKIKAKPKTKNTFKQILAISLNKKKTKGYFLSALFLMFSSLFVSYKIYYLIFSSLLLFFALFSWFNPSFNKIEKSGILK